MTKFPYVATTSSSISLSEIYRCITLLDTSYITEHPFHVPKLIKNYTTVSRLLPPAKPRILYSMLPDDVSYLNLEDKVLSAGVFFEDASNNVIVR